MKKLFLVYDQKGVVKAYPSFKEAKGKFDEMCSSHIKAMSDNPTFGYKRIKSDFDGNQVIQFRSWHKSVVKGKPKYFNDIFSLQAIEVE